MVAQFAMAGGVEQEKGRLVAGGGVVHRAVFVRRAAGCGGQGAEGGGGRGGGVGRGYAAVGEL